MLYVCLDFVVLGKVVWKNDTALGWLDSKKMRGLGWWQGQANAAARRPAEAYWGLSDSPGWAMGNSWRRWEWQLAVAGGRCLMGNFNSKSPFLFRISSPI